MILRKDSLFINETENILEKEVVKNGKKKQSCIGDFLFTHKSISGSC